MDELLDLLKNRYIVGDKKLLNAIIWDYEDKYIDYLYDLFIVEFNQPFGSATREIARQFYFEKMQSWLVAMKLFDPLLR